MYVELVQWTISVLWKPQSDWLVVKHLGECMEKDNFADLINMMANNLDDVDVDEEKVMVVMMMRRRMRMSMSLT